nr:DNA-binding protein [uncultured Cupriavidus sp.]
MVREANITQNQVNAAADALRAATGKKPTVRAVREELGTGSPATVLRMLDVWKANQIQAAETPLTLPVPLQRMLTDFLAQTVAQEKLELSSELAELRQVNADLGLENEHQTNNIGELQAELAACQSDRAALAGRVQQLEADLEVARGEAEQERGAAERVRTDLAKALLRLEALPRLETELAAVRADLDRERAARVAADQAAAVANAKWEGEVRARERIEAELSSVLAREEKTSDQVKDLTARMADGRLVRVRKDARTPVDLVQASRRRRPAGDTK